MHYLTQVGVKLLESSRGLARISRRIKAGHLDKNAPTVKQKKKDQLERYEQHFDKEGNQIPDFEPMERDKNQRGIIGGLSRGYEDEDRHQDSPPLRHVVKSARRAQSRGIGTFEPGRDQPGVIVALARQRKESPTVDKDIADKAKAYRRIRRMKAPPSMN